jgi:MFS family permease
MLLNLARRHRIAAQLLIALVVAFATRAWLFGDPVVQIDEQFYLLTGDRLLHGAIPYVDIWDRKPVGIFLLYAGIRLIGGEGIYQYQVVATVFAAGTAFLIARMAMRFTNGRGAALAGASYLLWLLIFDGAGGQTPVFYNLLMAGAGALVLRLVTSEVTHRQLAAGGSVAMLLVGIALQIKYSVLFEGVFFGLALLWRASRRGMSLPLALACALLWIVSALLPTFAALAWYSHAGHLDAFLYANFESVFQRGKPPPKKLLSRALGLAGMALPLLLCAYAGWRLARGSDNYRRAAARRFALMWLAASLIGVIVFGTYFIHYFLPVLVPLTLACAGLLGDAEAGVAIVSGQGVRRISIASFLAVTGVGLAIATVPKRIKDRGHEPEVRALAANIRANLHGCLFAFDADPILYLLSQACIPTSRVFPNHLNEGIESKAVGLDPLRETARIFRANRPDLVVLSDPPDPGYNEATRALVEREINADYRPIFRIKVGSHERIVFKQLTPPGLPPTAIAARATPARHRT